MENYIVSARKYRPTTFHDVVGQEALTETLRNAIKQNRLAHAYLFCGPRGVGKTTCARIFAKAINCTRSASAEPCNECESCQAFNDGRSFNIHELDAASNNSVEDIRNLINETRIPPQTGRYSVYIIDEVHMLSAAAFNALLKTLEEPPSYVIFILATTEKQKILPTILSRCQVYDFNRISTDDIIRHLHYIASREGIEATDEALNVVAQKADGGLRDALSIFDQLAAFSEGHITYEKTLDALNVLDSQYYFDIVDMAYKGDVRGVMLRFNDVLMKGFDASYFIAGLMQHMRDVLMAKDASTLVLLSTAEAIKQRYQQQAQSVSAKWLFDALALMNDCDIAYRTAKNKRLTVEIALIKLAASSAAVAEVPASKQSEQNNGDLAPRSTGKAPASSNAASPLSNAVSAAPAPQQQAIPAEKIPQIPHINPVQAAPKVPTVPTMPQMPQVPAGPHNASFSSDQLLRAWAGLLPLFKEEARMKAMLQEHLPTMAINPDDNYYQLTLKVANSLQKKELLKQMGTILTYLKRQLNNDSITLNIEVEEYNRSQMAFTAEEKLQLMEQKNPELSKIRELFKLQLE